MDGQAQRRRARGELTGVGGLIETAVVADLERLEHAGAKIGAEHETAAGRHQRLGG